MIGDLGRIGVLLVLGVFFGVSSCTNYSTTPAVQAPPTLVSLVSNGGGNYILTVRAQNPEIIFQGYRLYAGATEALARDPVDTNLGADCLAQASSFVQPFEYKFEIDPSDAPNTPGVSCRFFANVASGQFIALRALGLAINGSVSSFRVSGSSNALIVP